MSHNQDKDQERGESSGTKRKAPESKITSAEWKVIVANRRVNPMRGLVADGVLGKIIEDLGWERFVVVPVQGSRRIVNEFYTKLRTRKGSYRVKIEGKKVDFSPEAINRHYRILPKEGRELIPWEYIKSGVFTNREVMNFCQKKKDPLDLGTNFRTVEYKRLNHLIKTLVFYVSANLLPTDNYTAISRDRLEIAGCMKFGMRMNVGQIIWNKMIQVADETSRKKNVRLPFANLITELCALAGAFTELPNEEVITPKESLTMSSIADSEDEDEEQEEEHEGSGEATPRRKCRGKATVASVAREVAELRSAFEAQKLEQEQRWGEFQQFMQQLQASTDSLHDTIRTHVCPPS